MSKAIFSGLEGSGKSLKLAMVASEIAFRNGKWKKKSGITRPIYSNLKFSDEFKNYVETELKIPIYYWNDLNELIKIENADVFIDEVGNYFDSRMWSDLSLDVRRWLTQGSKMGIELYGTAQDFAQVDKAFRRLCNDLIHITKVIGSARPSPTKPPIRRIWGLCFTRALDPQGYDEDKKKFAGSFSMPGFFFIEREACEIFDTSQKILRSKPAPYKHVERECEIPGCRELSIHKKILHI